MTFDGRMISNVGVLAAIIEGGSFARAADALGLSPSGVSRAISRLEGRIGVRLLDRNTRSVTLTDEGRRLYADIGPLLSEIENALRVTSGSAKTVRGRLRVNVDAFFARIMFSAHVGRFLELYPEVSLELVTRDQLGDLLGEGFDIAIRFGTPPDSSMVARKLLETRTIMVASPAYLERHGTPEIPADLARHTCIQVRNSQTGQIIEDWLFPNGGEMLSVATHGRLVVNDVGTLLGACLTGVGIARIKAIGVQDLLDSGALVELLPDWPTETYPLYAIYPSRHLPAAKVRAFIDFVQETVAARGV
ncbi:MULTISPECIES: LysR family transcriptional regulator [unclassified Sinorhizobium]|uniref:LysR family transcriptional regulator n=1 Tax=unclassified Sinorhizobium TaxID=2613772 RepID=UPI003524352B